MVPGLPVGGALVAYCYLAWKPITDARIFPPHGGEGFTLDACVTALFHTAA